MSHARLPHEAVNCRAGWHSSSSKVAKFVFVSHPGSSFAD